MVRKVARAQEHVAAELGPLLGPRLDLVELHLERHGEDRVRIVALVDSSAGRQRLSEEDVSLTAVAAALLQRAPIYRSADGFREVAEPSTIRSPA